MLCLGGSLQVVLFGYQVLDPVLSWRRNCGDGATRWVQIVSVCVFAVASLDPLSTGAKLYSYNGLDDFCGAVALFVAGQLFS